MTSLVDFCSMLSMLRCLYCLCNAIQIMSIASIFIMTSAIRQAVFSLFYFFHHFDLKAILCLSFLFMSFSVSKGKFQYENLRQYVKAWFYY